VTGIGRTPSPIVHVARGYLTGYARWAARANAYGSLLTGAYPPFSMDEEPDYPVRLTVQEQTTARNRLTTFFRCLMLIPHEAVLSILGIAIVFVGFVAWLAGVVLSRVPEPLHNFLRGYDCWTKCARAYGYLLVDEYPPFSFTVGAREPWPWNPLSNRMSNSRRPQGVSGAFC